MENLNDIIAKNICKYRKNAKLTQNELAEKLNFSDKSVSKWERGESLPDVNVLMSMCKIFNITLNDIVGENIATPTTVKQKPDNRNKLIVTLLSSGLVWFIATVCFTFLTIFTDLNNVWLAFIYAIPVSSIVLLVFSCIWWPKWTRFACISALIWTLIVSICLTFGEYMWELLYIAIPAQILTMLWFMLKKQPKEKKEKKQKPTKNVEENINSEEPTTENIT